VTLWHEVTVIQARVPDHGTMMKKRCVIDKCKRGLFLFSCSNRWGDGHLHWSEQVEMMIIEFVIGDEKYKTINTNRCTANGTNT
jgi:hypothetical protein